MNELNEQKLFEFKRKSLILTFIRKKTDELYLEGKIKKKEKNKIRNLLLYEWRKNWNRNPNIPKSIKQAFNFLYF